MIRIWHVTIEDVDEDQFTALANQILHRFRDAGVKGSVLSITYELTSGNTPVSKNTVRCYLTTAGRYTLDAEHVRDFLGKYWKYHPLTVELHKEA